jgi:hypothetical protein
MHAVVGAEGALGAAEQVVVVLVPADALAAAEALGSLARPSITAVAAWKIPAMASGLASSARMSACSAGSV